MSRVTVKRYLLFAGVVYERAGGWDDFNNDYDALIDAETDGKEWVSAVAGGRWFQVVDLKTFAVVAED